MKIVVVEPVAQGGRIHYAYQMCKAMAEHGAEVVLVTSDDYELEGLPHNFRVDQCLKLWNAFDPKSMRPPSGKIAKVWRRVSWSARRVVRAIRMMHQYRVLGRYLVKHNPDVIQFGIIRFPITARFLARLRRRGLYLSQVMHEYELREQAGSRLVSWVIRLQGSTYHHLDTIFFHGVDPRDKFLSAYPYPKDQTHLIEHGNEALFLPSSDQEQVAFDPNRHYQLDPDDRVVLFFGILQPSKGLPDLIEAFAQVSRRSGHAKLLIVGYPSKHINLDEIRRAISDSGVADRITLDTRYVPMEQVGDLIRCASVVVFPYLSATQSGALQVAYAFGRPVVATTVGTMPQDVEDGRCGLLVPPSSPERLAEAVIEIMSNPKRAEEMGAHAKHLSDTRFAWEPIAANMLEVYRNKIRKLEP